jgi:hypothetical protein
VYLPPPLRRRLKERDQRNRAAGAAEALARERRARRRTRYRYVFVVAYGRSGSTLVQGLLNTLPRTVVAGENNFYVLPIYRALASVREFRHEHKRHGIKDPTSAFYRLGRNGRGPFVQAMNRIVTAGILGNDKKSYDVIGFKEVRWFRIEPEETEGFFAAMDEAFPGARYVLNSRNPEQVVKSGFWSRVDQHEALATIERTAAIQEYLRESRPDRTLDVPYEDLVDPDRAEERLRLMAEFVTGRPPSDELLGRLLEKLSVGHGPRPFGERRPAGGA